MTSNLKLLHKKTDTTQNKMSAYRIGEMFANHISDKELIYKILMNLYSSIKKHKQSTLKIGRETKQTLSQRRQQIA